MEPAKNKRVLFGALQAMGMIASADDPPDEMMRRILSKPSARTTGQVTEAQKVLTWDVWSIQERTNLQKAGFSADALEAEVAQRWKFIKRNYINDQMMPLPRDMVDESQGVILKNGWTLALVDKDVNYYRKDGPEESAAADDAGLADSADTLPTAPDSKPEKDADTPETVADKVATDDNPDIAIVRRRLANFLTACPVLSNPHADASKLAFAILPPDTKLLPHLTATEKRDAKEVWESLLGKREREGE